MTNPELDRLLGELQETAHNLWLVVLALRRHVAEAPEPMKPDGEGRSTLVN